MEMPAADLFNLLKSLPEDPNGMWAGSIRYRRISKDIFEVAFEILSVDEDGNRDWSNMQPSAGLGPDLRVKGPR